MDLNLSLGFQEQNDNKAIILTDTTNNYNSSAVTNLTAGDVVENDTFYEIVTDATTSFTTVGAATGAVGERFISTGTMTIDGAGELKIVTPTITEITVLTLDTTFTGVSDTPTIKPQIDLLSEFGPFTVQSEMVYTITNDLWGGTADTLIEDGLYEVDYNVTYKGAGGAASKMETLNTTLLVYGQIKVAVYDKFRQIPAWCNCQDSEKLHSILEADICGAYLTAIEQSAYIAKTEELINMLIVLDDMVKNGSKIYY